MSESEQNSENNSRQIKRRQKSECPVFFSNSEKISRQIQRCQNTRVSVSSNSGKNSRQIQRCQMVDHHFELAGKNRKES